MRPLVTLLTAAISLALWIVLAFVGKIPSGWVHLPLALAALLVAKAIIETDSA